MERNKTFNYLHLNTVPHDLYSRSISAHPEFSIVVQKNIPFLHKHGEPEIISTNYFDY